MDLIQYQAVTDIADRTVEKKGRVGKRGPKEACSKNSDV